MRLLASFIVLFGLVTPSATANEDKVSIETRLGIEQPKPLVSAMDRAFGAYQRGMYLTAFELALPEAQNGNAAAQTLIAELYENGQGIARDIKQATTWYGIAAKSGNREAQFAYSVKLMEGKHVEKDVELGLSMMKAAADAEHPIALFNYANHLVDQRPTSATYRKVLPLYQKAAEFRLADAYYALAKIYEEGLANGINNPQEAKVWLEKAARSGIDTAQVELAIKLLGNEPSPEDQRQAFGWFQTAASSGNVIAQNRLAHMHFKGIGVAQSDVEGAKWHILASRAGRKDFDLDQLMRGIADEDRKEALTLANRWPSTVK